MLGQLPFGKSELDESIHQRFAKIADSFPNKIAVNFMEKVLTYKELDMASDRVAQAVISQIGAASKPVGVLLEDRISFIIAILGILKAGKFYIPLDLPLPQTTLIRTLQITKTRLLIVDNRKTTPSCKKLGKDRVVLGMDEINSADNENGVSIPVTSEALAAVYFTSGSTGEPKGVKWDHCCMLHGAYVNVYALNITPNDHHSLIFSCTAAASVACIFGALLAGAELHLYNPSNSGIHKLASWLNKNEITILYLPVSLFRQLLYYLPEGDNLSFLRFVVVGGQTLYLHDVKSFEKKFSPASLLLNRLAMSEAGGLTYLFIDRAKDIAGEVVPVGYPIEDKNLSILDSQGNKVKEGEKGEIAVKSRYLSPGYWNNEKLTEKKFLPDPQGGSKRIYLTGDFGRMLQNNCLVHIGRNDLAVKIRGYRVEVGAIEIALHALDCIKECIVIAFDEKISGEKRLAAYVVTAPDFALNVSAIRKKLGASLPHYMIPSIFQFLERLPLAHTGKIDKQALMDPQEQLNKRDAHCRVIQSPIEENLSNIWKQTIGINTVGLDEDFFDVGGDSLQLMSIYTQIEKKFKISLSDVALAECNTIKKLARYIAQENTAIAPDNNKQLNHNGPKKLRQKMPGDISFLGSIVPYRWGATAIFQFCRWSWFRNICYGPRKAIISKFIKLANHTSYDGKALVAKSITCNVRLKWRHFALSRTSNKEFQEWVTIRGMSNLDKCKKKNNGVILLGAHTVMISMVFEILDRLGEKKVMFVGQGGRRMMNIMGISNGSTKNLLHSPLYRSMVDKTEKLYLRTFELHSAHRVLAQRGIVVMLGDGYVGKSGFVSPFLGRQRKFGAGFARLALESGASILPVFSSMENKGQVTIEFLAPFDNKKNQTDSKANEKKLITTYIRLLEQKWENDVSSIVPHQIKSFLKLPLEEGAGNINSQPLKKE